MFDAVELCETGRKLSGVDARLCTDDELFDATVGLGKLIDLAQVAQAHLLAELDDRRAPDVRFGMRTAPWAAGASGSAPGPVRRRLRVGRALARHFDEIDHAVSAGDLSFDHAATLVDVANPRTTDALAGAQAEIIALADGATFDKWKRDVAALAEHADTEGAEPDPYADNTLKMPVTLEGTTRLDGTLDAAAGLAFRSAINAKADELFRRFTRDHEAIGDIAVPDRATLRALALVELLRTATGCAPTDGSAPRAEVTLVLHDHEGHRRRRRAGAPSCGRHLGL